MNQEQLYGYLVRELDYSASTGEGVPDWINIKETLEGTINLSEILMKAFLSIERNKEINFDFERFIFRVRILNDFENIQIDNRFPKQVFFENCSGKNIQVSQTLMTKFEEARLLGLRIINSEIDKILIIGNLSGFASRGIRNCQKIEINQIGNIQILPYRYTIRGAIKCIDLLGVSSERILIELDDTPGQITQIRIKEPTVAKMRITSLAHWSLSVYDEGSFESLNIISKNRVVFINISSVAIQEYQMTLETEECGRVKFDGVKSIKYLKIMSDLAIPDSSIEKIEILNCSLEKTFIGSFSNFNLSNGITFQKFINYGDLSLEYVYLKKPLECLNSVLGKIYFFNSDIGETINTDGSNFEDIKFLGTDMPKKVVVFGLLPNGTDKTKKIEGYRQLKLISEKNGNKEQANFYRSKELDLHLQTLKFPSEMADILMLGANKISNKHGLDWSRPLLLIFFVTGPILFSCFLKSLSYNFDYSESGFDTMKKLWGNYLDFLIPGYLYPSKDKFAFVQDLGFSKDFKFSSLPVLSKIIVMFNDVIFMPYLIYQAIAAFRKHGVK